MRSADSASALNGNTSLEYMEEMVNMVHMVTARKSEGLIPVMNAYPHKHKMIANCDAHLHLIFMIRDIKTICNIM